MKNQFIIKDWAGNLIKFKGRPHIFDSLDDAEEVLCEELDENYETDRQEYEIQPIESF
jgi:hypothetical protein